MTHLQGHRLRHLGGIRLQPRPYIKVCRYWGIMAKHAWQTALHLSTQTYVQGGANPAPANRYAQGTFKMNPHQVPAPPSSSLPSPCTKWLRTDTLVTPDTGTAADGHCSSKEGLAESTSFTGNGQNCCSQFQTTCQGKVRGSFKLLQKDKESAVSAFLPTRSLPCSQRPPFYLGCF